MSCVIWIVDEEEVRTGGIGSSKSPRKKPMVISNARVIDMRAFRLGLNFLVSHRLT